MVRAVTQRGSNYENCLRFTQDNFKVWFADPKLRRNPLKSKILSNKSWQGLVSCIDAMTFQAYDSFVDFRKMKGGLPLTDAVDDEFPQCFLTSSNLHRLDYFPEQVTILPTIQEESLDLLYSSSTDEIEEEDLYSQVASGKTSFSPYQKRPSRKQIEQDLTTRPRNLIIWRIWGNSKIKLHKYSKLMSSIYNSFPSKSIKGVLKIDKLLFNLSKGKYKYELLILKGAFYFLLFHLFITVLKS